MNINCLLNEPYLDLNQVPRREWKLSPSLEHHYILSNDVVCGICLTNRLKEYLNPEKEMTAFQLNGTWIYNLEDFNAQIHEYRFKIEKDLLIRLYLPFIAKFTVAQKSLPCKNESKKESERKRRSSSAKMMFDFTRQSVDEQAILLEIPDYALDRNLLRFLSLLPKY